MALPMTDAGAFDDPEPIGRITDAPRPTHEISHELEIAAAPDQVFAALTTHGGLAQWWPALSDGQPSEGSTLALRFADGTEFSARVDLLDQARDIELVHWQVDGGPDEWTGTTIAFRVEGIDTTGDGSPDAGTKLRFWHGGWEYGDGLLPHASFQWAMALAALRVALEAPPS